MTNLKNTYKILIVDDDEISGIFLETVLESIASEILNAETGQEAIEQCRKHPDIDLILMDIKMPGISGLDATREIRTFNQDVIIIAQTAYALADDKENSLKAGCNDYISKPINKDEMLDKIEKNLNR